MPREKLGLYNYAPNRLSWTEKRTYECWLQKAVNLLKT